MKECFQTEKQTVFEHGHSVWKYTQKILNEDWELLLLPQWLKDNFFKIKHLLLNIETIQEYNIYHDCGKPFCVEIDDSNTQHFPNHAEVSANIWSKVSNNIDVINLIRLDMVLHTETAKQINDRKLQDNVLLTLFITALAELHSNAEMFGGIDSLSFKIKYKKICKRGKMIMRGLS